MAKFKVGDQFISHSNRNYIFEIVGADGDKFICRVVAIREGSGGVSSTVGKQGTYKPTDNWVLHKTEPLIWSIVRKRQDALGLTEKLRPYHG